MANIPYHPSEADLKASPAMTATATYDITWTANEPTAGTTATIADGDVPTVAELGQAVADITAILNQLQVDVNALRGHLVS